MTNADKYFKEGANIGIFVTQLVKRISHFDSCKYYSGDMAQEIALFLNEQLTPTLTEDERVILRNIKNVGFNDKIGRWKEDGKLYLKGTAEMKAFAINTMYAHLFQFIKERRRILY